MLPLVPDGTLFAGAHDHLRFVEHIGRYGLRPLWIPEHLPHARLAATRRRGSCELGTLSSADFDGDPAIRNCSPGSVTETESPFLERGSYGRRESDLGVGAC